MIAQLSSTQADFQEKLSKLLAWESVSNTDIAKTVDDIIANIRSTGDDALISYTNQFDRMNVNSMADLTIELSELKQAFDTLNDKEKTALQTAADRVRGYHQKQNKRLGLTRKTMALCWVKKSPRLIGLVCMCLVAKPPTLHPC